MEENTSPSYAIPVAIIIGFGLIAAAIFFSGKSVPAAPVAINDAIQNAEQAGQPSPSAVNPVSEDDHIRGNPNAPIVIVEYSDYDCPFCKNFHETMQRVMDEYGDSGQVAWVYRHFPLEQLHPNAPMLAQSAECVASLGGSEAFWTFSDLIFNEREVNAQTNPTVIPEYVASTGVDIDAFDSCMDSGETKTAVEEDFTNAVAVGGRGTPHSIVIVGDQQGVINGAQPYDVVKGIIDNLIAQVEGGGA